MGMTETIRGTERCMQKLAEISLEQGAKAAILWKDGQTRWEGPDTDKPFYAWSITKSFTSLCCGLMVDDGKLDIDVPAVCWLPELERDYPQLTLRHLLTFTGGLDMDESQPLALRAPRYPLGSHFHYSLESEWVALAVTRAAGESMYDLFRRRIGEPIGMDASQWSWGSITNADGLPVNGGSGTLEAGVTITPRTLLRFGQCMLQRGQWDGRQLISRAWLDDAQCSQPLTRVPPWQAEDGWYRDWLPGTYGLHWWCNGPKRDGTRLWPAAPASTFAAQGNLNQICLIVPEWNSILIRMGSDGVIDNGRYDEVLQAIQQLS